MHCPNCGAGGRLDVKDTRELPDGGIRRRRRCRECAADFFTTEHFSQERLRVSKSDGRIVPFDRRNIHKGIVKAAVRPQHNDRLAELIEAIAQDVIGAANPDGVVSSADIARLVLEHLKEFDEVTHVRYALAQVGRRDSALNPHGWSDANDFRSWLITEYPELKHLRPPTRISEVVKRDGRREPYEKRKVARSVGMASKGRRTSEKSVRDLADQVADEVENDLRDQAIVTTAQIAGQIMFRLRKLDQIAAIRYASTAKQFTAVADYETEAVSFR